MMEKLSLNFRAHIIANSTRLSPHGGTFKRVVQIAERELNEAAKVPA